MQLEVFEQYKDDSVLYISGISHDNAANGPGIRTVLFTQGCYHRCKGCHNTNTWSPAAGEKLTVEEVVRKLTDTSHFNKLTLSGGEPVLQYKALTKLLYTINPIKPVWMWTGYTDEELLKLCKLLPDMPEFLSKISHIVTGRFEIDKKDSLLHWRGSSNQKICKVVKGDDITLEDVSVEFDQK